MPLNKFVICFLILSCAFLSCPRKSAIIVKKEKIFQEKCLSLDEQNNVKLKFIINKDSTRHNIEDVIEYNSVTNKYIVKGENHFYTTENSDYIFLGPHHSEDWIRLIVYCIQNDSVIFDSGTINYESGICIEKNIFFFFLDGHSKKEKTDSCFPKEAKISGLLKIFENSGTLYSSQTKKSELKH